MEYKTLGRTGLRVSVAGLGCGGPSRLGLRDNRSERECVSLVRQAVDLGVNFLDTAEAYGTEEIVGKAIASFPREKIVLSTKKSFPLTGRDPSAEVRKSLEQSLKRLRTDYIDIYHVHGVEPEHYASAYGLVPTLVKLRDEGKIRFLGITEAFVDDTTHRMLQQALKDGCWDIIMVGFNMLNQSARMTVLPETIKKNIGVLIMFAVRRALSQPARLRQLWAELKGKGLVDPALADGDDPLRFLIEDRIAASIPEAAYRFCRYEPGVHVVLTGTGNTEHLKENLEAVVKSPLPEATVRRLRGIFARLDCVTGN
ncbi:MAG TPA: aldo/keto reductase [Candidatus Binatia bacterium]|nr:aldo/keto reductase [Candidatus Binatia bacterium]